MRTPLSHDPGHPRRTRTVLALASWLGLLLPLAPAPAGAGIEVYRRTDEAGVVRYTLKRTPTEDEPAGSEPTRAPQPADEAADEAKGAAPPSSGPPPSSEPPTVDSRTSDAEGADAASPGDDIRRQIERDREVLREIVSGEREAGRESPALREISDRLPRLQSELEAVDELEAVESDPSP